MTEPVRPLIASATAALASVLKRGLMKQWKWLLGFLLGSLLAWHAFDRAVLTSAWELLSGISPFTIFIIVAINLLMLPLMTARWWILLTAMGGSAGFLNMCAYRLAANTISYLTPGPHFGGEPLSVYLLYHRSNTSLTSATTSVTMDRLLELMASFLVFALCLSATPFIQHGFLQQGQGLIFILFFFVVVTAIFAALQSGRRPLSGALLIFRKWYRRRLPSLVPTTRSFTRAVFECETRLESLFRDHGHRFLLANLFSLVHWGAVFTEFWLLCFFLGSPLSLLQLVGVVAVARLAFYTPLPAGIGVLESTLPWTTAALGLGSGLGLSLCLIIRLRDLVFCFAGLGLTLKYLTCQRKTVIISHASDKNTMVQACHSTANMHRPDEADFLPR